MEEENHFAEKSNMLEITKKFSTFGMDILIRKS
jgi:hypothetical protein